MVYRKLIEADSWKSAARELLLIVAGVMIALWIGSLHESRVERHRERATLVRLLTATRETEQGAIQAVFEDSIAGYFQSSLRAAMVGKTTLMPDSLSALIWRCIWSGGFHPLTGIFNAAALTGDLNLIRNDSLRTAIMSLTGQIEGTVQAIRLDEAAYNAPVQQGVWITQRLEQGPPPREAAEQWLKSEDLQKAVSGWLLYFANHRGNILDILPRLTAMRQALEHELDLPSVPAKPPHPIIYFEVKK
ncbi:MAG TPA: hypothetical protein VM100_07635 [Longimicrobiales bacterium]|nr:hypothetical protein [Longimicrobiales bacterium]